MFSSHRIRRFKDKFLEMQESVEKQPLIAFITLCILISLAISLFFFSPKFWLWDLSKDGAFEVDRANSFLDQCQHPFSPRESALKWRLLLPTICNLLGLREWAALSLSWIGVVALLAQTAWIILRLTGDRLRTLMGSILVATTSAITTSTNWLGINDCFYLIGLMAVSFSQPSFSVFLACLIGPWLDEKFIIALPIALAVRFSQYQIISDRESESLCKILRLTVIGLLPYFLVRCSFILLFSELTTENFVRSALKEFLIWLPWVPLGWWMAFRLSWFLIACSLLIILLRSGQRAFIVTLGSLLLSSLIVTVLAADISRSAAIALPILVLGWITFPQIYSGLHSQTSSILVFGNLLVPACHVTYTKIAFINPLPLELFRSIRILLRHFY